EYALDYMGLIQMQHRYLDELSGGQRQRAYIAMVIAQNTKYILLDEPLNNLDIKHAVQMMKMLKRLSVEQCKTIIIVLHDINFASVYSDYIVSMKNGNLIEIDKADQAIEKSKLEDLYGIEMEIHQIDNKKICVYF
ncbi:MAG: ATP-binding cassette domain-containing protein, partial [Oscillospiraceae bacterium]